MNFMEIKSHNFNDIQKYWEVLYEKDQLDENETIRIVPQIYTNPEKPLIFTDNKKINSLQSLYNYINNLDSKNGFGNVGYSISSAIFEYDENKKDSNGKIIKPSAETFKRIKNLVIDVDFYLSGTKDRFVLGYIEDPYIKFALFTVYLSIVEELRKNNLPIVRPKIAGMTGSGLQFVFSFDRWINKDEAQTIYNYLKRVFDIKTDVLTKDTLGNFSKVQAEIDSSSLDIVHVQRVLGTVNQKYKTLSKIYNLFDIDKIGSEVDQVRSYLINEIENSNYTQQNKHNYKKYIDIISTRIKSVVLNESISDIKIDEQLQIAKMQQHINKSKSYIKPSDLKNAELELLYKLKEEGISVVDIVRDYVEIDHESSKFVALKCPFHDDNKYSFAIYINDTIDIFYDFHDQKAYTLVTFWEKLFNVSKSTAISQIAQAAGIKLGKSFRKDYENLEIEEIVEHLLEKIDTENFVYYRLANKNRTCIVRHKDTGEAFVFDGPKMLASHVLLNQLKIEEADKKLVDKFIEMFQEKVLIEAFEEFAPGKPTIFSREFIKFVNLWVPSKNYKESHELAKELPKYNLDEILEVLKEKTPWTFKYLLQITQKGNILWFINWLAGTARFHVMPTIPVVFGVPGVGKNLFVNTIIEWYHNSEYTKVLNSDRVMSNFNSILEDASFVVLDEGDISSSRDFDALKFLSGNEKIAIEKKGVDVQMKKRYFNIILFSNGEVPVRHHYNDRRIQYFYTEKTLLQSCESWGLSIEEFIEKIKAELKLFWAILLNLELKEKWLISNDKDKLFITQILKQHSFGELILKLLSNEWQDIALQLNENVSDPSIMKGNLELLEEIQFQFKNSSEVSLTLINRYLNALNFKYKTSVQQFIRANNLKDLGIEIIVGSDDVKIKIDKNKLLDIVNIPNILEDFMKKRISKKAIEKVSEKVSELENIDSENFKATKETDNIIAEKTIEENFNSIASTPPGPPPNTTLLI